MGCGTSQPQGAQLESNGATSNTRLDRRKLHQSSMAANEEEEEDVASRHSEALSDHESGFSTDKFLETMGRKQCRPRSAGHICPQPSKAVIRDRIELIILRAQVARADDMSEISSSRSHNNGAGDDAMSQETVNSDKDSVDETGAAAGDQPKPVLTDLTARVESSASSGEVNANTAPSQQQRAEKEGRAWKRRERRRNRRIKDFLEKLPLSSIELTDDEKHNNNGYLDRLCCCSCSCAADAAMLNGVGTINPETTSPLGSSAPTWCKLHSCKSAFTFDQS